MFLCMLKLSFIQRGHRYVSLNILYGLLTTANGKVRRVLDDVIICQIYHKYEIINMLEK